MLSKQKSSKVVHLLIVVAALAIVSLAGCVVNESEESIPSTVRYETGSGSATETVTLAVQERDLLTPIGMIPVLAVTETVVNQESAGHVASTTFLSLAGQFLGEETCTDTPACTMYTRDFTNWGNLFAGHGAYLLDSGHHQVVHKGELVDARVVGANGIWTVRESVGYVHPLLASGAQIVGPFLIPSDARILATSGALEFQEVTLPNALAAPESLVEIGQLANFWLLPEASAQFDRVVAESGCVSAVVASTVMDLDGSVAVPTNVFTWTEHPNQDVRHETAISFGLDRLLIPAESNLARTSGSMVAAQIDEFCSEIGYTDSWSRIVQALESLDAFGPVIQNSILANNFEAREKTGSATLALETSARGVPGTAASPAVRTSVEFQMTGHGKIAWTGSMMGFSPELITASPEWLTVLDESPDFATALQAWA